MGVQGKNLSINLPFIHFLQTVEMLDHFKKESYRQITSFLKRIRLSSLSVNNSEVNGYLWNIQKG